MVKKFILAGCMAVLMTGSAVSHAEKAQGSDTQSMAKTDIEFKVSTSEKAPNTAPVANGPWRGNPYGF